MINFFHKRFEEEVLSSEKLRTSILVCMALFAVVYILANNVIFSSVSPDSFHGQSLWTILFFHCAPLVFEVLTWLRIDYKIKKRKYAIENFNRYTNSLIEICSPAIIIFIIAKQYPSPVTILHAPLAYLYFVFIVLSTLRLDFKLSLFTGCMAAAGFFTVSLILIKEAQQKAMVP